MKFEVKVGKEFEGDVVLRVEAVPESQPKNNFSLKKAVTYVLVAVILAGTLASIAYGIKTGDYSGMKKIVETTGEIVRAAIPLKAT